MSAAIASIEDRILDLIAEARAAGLPVLAGGLEVAIEEATEEGEIA